MVSFYKLLLQPESFSFFSLIFNFGNPDTLNNNIPNLHKKAKTMKDSGRSSKMMSSCKWSISNTFEIYSQHYLIAEYQNSQEQVPSFTSNFGLFWT